MKYLIALGGVLLLLAGCAPRELPRRPRPTPLMATRVPAPVPIPTRSPLGLTRSVSAPAAPTVLAGSDSVVVNAVCVGDCVLGGGASWVTSDTLVVWNHADPPAVDYYEVYRADMEPFFDPATCAGCALATTTTAMEAVVTAAPNGFNPVGGTANANVWSELTTFRVRACNAGGCSAISNEIGSFNYSLLQGAALPER